MELPDCNRRLAKAAMELERAVGFTWLTHTCKSGQAERLRMAATQMSHASQSLEKETFSFFAAGGWALDRLFDGGYASDLDIWFAPHSSVLDDFLLCAPKSFYPCDIHMVVDPLDAIEAFDLHICQVAIKVDIRQGQRHYSAWATRAFASAFLYGLAHITRIPQAVAMKERLACRIQKYNRRGFTVHDCFDHVLVGTSIETAMPLPQSVLKFERNFGQLSASGIIKPYWKISFKDRYLSSCTFYVDEPPVRDLMPEAEPMLIYPCCLPCDLNTIAFENCKACHWLARAWASRHDSYISFKSGLLLDARLVQPRWFADKLQYSTQELRDALNDICPKDFSTEHRATKKIDVENFYMACSWHTAYQLRISNYATLPPASGKSYGSSWVYVMTPKEHGCIGETLCVEDMQPGPCRHAAKCEEIQFARATAIY